MRDVREAMGLRMLRPIDLGILAGTVASVYGEPVIELPHDLYIPPEALEIFLEAFEGPLDLLLT